MSLLKRQRAKHPQDWRSLTLPDEVVQCLKNIQATHADVCKVLKEAIQDDNEYTPQDPFETYYVPQNIFRARDGVQERIVTAFTQLSRNTSRLPLERRLRSNLTFVVRDVAELQLRAKDALSTVRSDHNKRKVTCRVLYEYDCKKYGPPPSVIREGSVHRRFGEVPRNTFVKQQMQQAYDLVQEAQRTLEPLLESQLLRVDPEPSRL